MVGGIGVLMATARYNTSNDWNQQFTMMVSLGAVVFGVWAFGERRRTRGLYVAATGGTRRPARTRPRSRGQTRRLERADPDRPRDPRRGRARSVDHDRPGRRWPVRRGRVARAGEEGAGHHRRHRPRLADRDAQDARPAETGRPAGAGSEPAPPAAGRLVAPGADRERSGGRALGRLPGDRDTARSARAARPHGVPDRAGRSDEHAETRRAAGAHLRRCWTTGARC